MKSLCWRCRKAHGSDPCPAAIGTDDNDVAKLASRAPDMRLTYTEDQIRADVRFIEESDLNDDVALALMRLAHALCGSSMLRGLIARTHRENLIVQKIVETRAAVWARYEAWAKAQSSSGQAGGGQGDDGAVPRDDAAVALVASVEPAARCSVCSAEYSADEYAALDARSSESHFRGCMTCGRYEVYPS